MEKLIIHGILNETGNVKVTVTHMLNKAETRVGKIPWRRA